MNLQQLVGKNIKHICNNDYTKNGDSHCAHFVSHVLGFTFGYTCDKEVRNPSVKPGASIKVQEIFSKCLKVGHWSDRPSGITRYLAFATTATRVNLKSKTMPNIRKKHVGIYYQGYIYHYNNKQNRVVKVSPDKFSRHYGSNTNVFYGTILPRFLKTQPLSFNKPSATIRSN